MQAKSQTTALPVPQPKYDPLFAIFFSPRVWTRTHNATCPLVITPKAFWVFFNVPSNSVTFEGGGGGWKNRFVQDFFFSLTSIRLCRNFFSNLPPPPPPSQPALSHAQAAGRGKALGSWLTLPSPKKIKCQSAPKFS